jgi:acetoin utilization deacetylase AcuC-like enzyme
VHHGNGTQDIFYGSGSVLYCSLHQSPLYPGTGAAAETGTGQGEGTTLNVPLPPGTDGDAFLGAFRERIVPAIEAFAPRLLLVSAGYDAHRDDPISGLELTDETFGDLMRDAIDLADRSCGGRLGVVLEGGYDVNALARCVADAIEILDAATAPY